MIPTASYDLVASLSRFVFKSAFLSPAWPLGIYLKFRYGLDGLQS